MMKTLEKYKNGWPGPLSSLYEATYNDYIIVVKFYDKYWFDKEIEFYYKLQDKPYCYDLVEINNLQMSISFKHENKNLNHLFHKKQDIEIDYKTEVKNILCDLEKQGIRKINVYPHTFFIHDGKLKICDLFGCTNETTMLSKDVLQSIINDKNRFPFVDGFLDCKEAYNLTLEQSENYWPEKILWKN